MKTMQIQWILYNFDTNMHKNNKNQAKPTKISVFSMKPYENQAKSIESFDFSSKHQ